MVEVFAADDPRYAVTGDEGEMTEVFLTVEETAEALGFSYPTVIKWVRAGEFPHARMRGRNAKKLGYRIPATDVLARAQLEGEDIVLRAEAVVGRVRRQQEALLATLAGSNPLIE